MQKATKHTQDKYKKICWRCLVVIRTFVMPKTNMPVSKKIAITFKVTARFSLKTMLSIPSIEIAGTKRDSFLNCLVDIHSGSFQTSTNITGRKQADNIDS